MFHLEQRKNLLEEEGWKDPTASLYLSLALLAPESSEFYTLAENLGPASAEVEDVSTYSHMTIFFCFYFCFFIFVFFCF